MTPIRIPYPDQLNADLWQLYTDRAGCDEVATALTQIVLSLPSCGNAVAAFEEWECYALAFSRYGAVDTEPRNVFLAYLSLVFPGAYDVPVGYYALSRENYHVPIA